ncbi:MAG TPA: hypothetical protein VFZ97_12320 [Acidimicrobiales bacterium]
MPVPLPSLDATNLSVPDAAEVAIVSRAVATAAAPPGGLTETQQLLVRSVLLAMTGHPAALDQPPVTAPELAAALRNRNEAYRSRIVQIMTLVGLVLRPIPQDVADRIAEYAAELSVDEGMVEVARQFAAGSLGLAAFDFKRNGYTAGWSSEDAANLHTTVEISDAWDFDLNDPDLAARWRAMEKLPEESLGRRVTDFYRARGFNYPGLAGSAPPLLAQHDWVHVLADYGTTVESELEVFAFIARANDDPRGFSLLAMVVSLFETGYLRSGAGLFESSPGHLSRTGMAERVADAMYRGAKCSGSVDFLGLDWFELADLPVEDACRHFGVLPKSAEALKAGAVGPWETGGISPFQVRAGKMLAESDGRPYEPFGARVAEVT